MAEPISFPSTTSNAGLPLLFSGQSQKEFFLNQSLELVDALLLKAVEATLGAPPAEPEHGTCYLVGPDASADWTGRSDQIAIRIGGSWHFVMPAEGMTLFDRDSGQTLIYRSQWYRPNAPQAPDGGAIIDAEARATVTALIATLQGVGILPGSD